MAILYAFDNYKNKVAFNGDTDIPITVPMQLPDGSVIFYDRGASYGEYKINSSGYPERIDGAIDDDSAESRNWRYLICNKHDLDSTEKQWGPRDTSEGLTGTAVGYGLPNTEAMIAKYATNTSYWWKLIKEKRDSTGLKWFMPSEIELDSMYENRNIITSEGGDAFQNDRWYWSSSEGSINTAWGQDFSNGNRSNINKRGTHHCRLLRRI